MNNFKFLFAKGSSILNFIKINENKYLQIYLQKRKYSNNNTCNDNLNICINTINKYLYDSNKQNITDKDIDIILFHLYKIISCTKCNNVIDLFIYKNKLLCNFGINDYEIINNIIIGNELNKYIKYETIKFIKPLKLNHLTLRSSILLCKNNMILNKK